MMPRGLIRRSNYTFPINLAPNRIIFLCQTNRKSVFTIEILINLTRFRKDFRVRVYHMFNMFLNACRTNRMQVNILLLVKVMPFNNSYQYHRYQYVYVTKCLQNRSHESNILLCLIIYQCNAWQDLFLSKGISSNFSDTIIMWQGDRYFPPRRFPPIGIFTPGSFPP